MSSLWSSVGLLVLMAVVVFGFFRIERRRKCRFLPVCESVSAGHFGNVDEILSRHNVTPDLLLSSPLAQLPGMGAAALFVINNRSVAKTASQMNTNLGVAHAVYEILDKQGLIAEEQFLADLAEQQSS